MYNIKILFLCVAIFGTVYSFSWVSDGSEIGKKSTQTVLGYSESKAFDVEKCVNKVFEIFPPSGTPACPASNDYPCPGNPLCSSPTSCVANTIDNGKTKLIVPLLFEGASSCVNDAKHHISYRGCLHGIDPSRFGGKDIYCVPQKTLSSEKVNKTKDFDFEECKNKVNNMYPINLKCVSRYYKTCNLSTTDNGNTALNPPIREEDREECTNIAEKYLLTTACERGIYPERFSTREIHCVKSKEIPNKPRITFPIFKH